MIFQYVPDGVCSREIQVEIHNGIIAKVRFSGGCSGNLQGIAALVEGLPADEVAEKLQGIKCGVKGTSCPDQLARAITAHLSDQGVKNTAGSEEAEGERMGEADDAMDSISF